MLKDNFGLYFPRWFRVFFFYWRQKQKLYWRQSVKNNRPTTDGTSKKWARSSEKHKSPTGGTGGKHQQVEIHQNLPAATKKKMFL